MQQPPRRSKDEEHDSTDHREDGRDAVHDDEAVEPDEEIARREWRSGEPGEEGRTTPGMM